MVMLVMTSCTCLLRAFSKHDSITSCNICVCKLGAALKSQEAFEDYHLSEQIVT